MAFQQLNTAVHGYTNRPFKYSSKDSIFQNL